MYGTRHACDVKSDEVRVNATMGEGDGDGKELSLCSAQLVVARQNLYSTRCDLEMERARQREAVVYAPARD